jgi:hypothetical protein
VDPPNDGNHLSFDGGDGKTNGSDDNSVVNIPQHISAAAASPEQLLDNAAQLVQMTNLYTMVRTSMRDYVQKTLDDMYNLLIKMNDHAIAYLKPFYNILEGALQWMDEVLTDNTTLHVAYNACRAETVALKATMDTLTWTFNEQIANPLSLVTAAPPLHLQQPAPKPSSFPSDSDSQHSFTYLCEFPESST